MRKPGAAVAAILALLMIAADAPIPAAGVEAVPLIDLHFHPEEGWDYKTLVQLFDQLGVGRAGNGAVVVGPPPPSGLDSPALQLAEQYPDRFIPFTGQTALRRFIRDEGEKAWKLESKAVMDYLEQMKAALAVGRFKGIGELFVNNNNSRPAGTPASIYPADSPLMKRLWNFSATYGVPLSVHMEPTPESLAQMERLLVSNRGGTWIWAHAGNYGEPDLIHRLLRTHPNLYCELSQRDLRTRPYKNKIVDDNGLLIPAWKELLEEFPDRFVIGTDVDQPSLAMYSESIRFWRQLLDQLPPGTAAKVAHQNAEHLLKLLMTYRFPITYEENSFIVEIRSGSNISNFLFIQPQKQISFNASITPAIGRAEVILPRRLLGGPYNVLIDRQMASVPMSANATHATFTITYPSGSHNIKIMGTTAIPEFPVSVMGPLAIALAASLLLTQRSRVRKPMK